MIDSASLHAELSMPAYAGMDEAQVLEALNAKTRVRRQPSVPMDEVRNFHVKTGILLKLEAAVSNTAIDAALDPMAFPGAGKRLRNKIYLFVFTLRSSNHPLDFNNSDVVASLPLLVQLGIVTGFEAEAFKGLAETPISRAEELLGTAVVLSAQDIRAARLYPKYLQLQELLRDESARFEERVKMLSGATADLSAGVDRDLGEWEAA